MLGWEDGELGVHKKHEFKRKSNSILNYVMMGHVDKILKGPVKKARLMLLPSTKDPHAAEYLPRESGDSYRIDNAGDLVTRRTRIDYSRPNALFD
jgi:hypothetical protein